MKKNIAIWASGTGSNAQKIIEYFQHDSTVRIALLVSNKKDIPFNLFSEKYSIPLLLLKKNDFFHSQDCIQLFTSYRIDLHVLAGFLWKIPDYLISNYPKKIINIHPSLLPKYGGKNMYGMHVHNAVFENKEKVSGISIHYVNEHFDEGELIFQKKVSIEDCNSPKDIQQRVLKLEHLYYAETIKKILLD